MFKEDTKMKTIEYYGYVYSITDLRELYPDVIFAIELPHRGNARVWKAEDTEQLISYADQSNNYGYAKHDDKEAFVGMYEDEEDAIECAPEAMELFKNHTSIIEYYAGNDTEYYSVENAPSEFDCAVEELGHDLQAFTLLTHDEAIQLICSKGRSAGALVNFMQREGFLVESE